MVIAARGRGGDSGGGGKSPRGRERSLPGVLRRAEKCATMEKIGSRDYRIRRKRSGNMAEKTERIGFLGFGQMGSAIAEGLAEFSPDVKDGILRMAAWAPHGDKLKKRIEDGGLPVEICSSPRELAETSDWILLAMKPDQLAGAAEGIRDLLAGKRVISVVNAVRLERLREILGDGPRIQYVLPNTPMKVGAGVALFEEETGLTEDELARAKRWFSSIAEVVVLPGEKIAAAASLSGCAPAFFFMAAEALGDAGVKHGLKRADAYRLAAAVMSGAGSLLAEELKAGAHPGALKDAVCSPGGTTIRGVSSLESDGFRSAWIKAVDATLG